MELFLGLLVLVGALLYLPRLLADKKTKLFRRIWSSEVTGGLYGSEKQNEALNQLLIEFGVDFGADEEVINQKISDLLADATRFDVRYQQNMGVQVMPVLARRLAHHLGLKDKPDIVAVLSAMASIDGVAAYKAMRSSIDEVKRP